jgi:hypothetical protein
MASLVSFMSIITLLILHVLKGVLVVNEAEQFMIFIFILLLIVSISLLIAECFNKRYVELDGNTLVWYKSRKKTLSIHRINQIMVGYDRITIGGDDGISIPINKSNSLFGGEHFITIEKKYFLLNLYKLALKNKPLEKIVFPVRIKNPIISAFIFFISFFCLGVASALGFVYTGLISFLIFAILSLASCAIFIMLLFTGIRGFIINNDSIELVFPNKNRNKKFELAELEHSVWLSPDGNPIFRFYHKTNRTRSSRPRLYIIRQKILPFSVFQLDETLSGL